MTITVKAIDAGAAALYVERWGSRWTETTPVEVVRESLRRQAKAVVDAALPDLLVAAIDHNHIALVEAIAKAVDHELVWDIPEGACYGPTPCRHEPEPGCAECATSGWPCDYVTTIVEAVERVGVAGATGQLLSE